MFIFLMKLRPPRTTRTDTLFPYTTLFRSRVVGCAVADHACIGDDDVDATQLGVALVEDLRDSRRVAHVSLADHHGAPFLLDQGGGLLQVVPRYRQSTRLNSSH